MPTKPLTGIFTIAAPAALAILELFHPHPHDLLHVDVSTWLFVHYSQLLLFPLAALALAMLVREQNSIAGTVCRVSLFFFAVAYLAFDTAAGVVTGILVSAGRNSGALESWRPAVEAIWTHPIVGGIGSPFLGVLGAIAISVSTVAAAVTVRRSGASWPPVLLLGLSGFGISVFKTHAWPGGPLTFGGIAIASAWLLLERNARARVNSGSTAFHA